MKLAKIPRADWPRLRYSYAQERQGKCDYYISRVFHEDTRQHRVALDGEYICGAISYSIEKTFVHVYSLGSRVPGAGTKLMRHVEGVARNAGLPVKLAAERAALGFYLKRGYKPLPAQKKTDRIIFLRKVFTSRI